MHQGLHGAGHEAVVDEEVFVNIEVGILSFQIAGAIAGHAMAQREVLRPGRRADRIGLHEAERIERALQRGGREKAASDGRAPQVIEGHEVPLSLTANSGICSGWEAGARLGAESRCEAF